ncbi:MAG: helix-turn-helix transcriptional regulator [Christensenellaceae bacterium]|nr:helix-turn-helix transcriptional regulator [Christensenellaceae bacterium]
MEYMKRARKRRHMTQAQLGQLIGLSVSAISLYETGRRKPPVDIAKLIASALGFGWKRFYEDDDM